MTRSNTKRIAARASVMPPSWNIENWPPEIWPNTVERGRYVVRAYRDSLLVAGALSRVGRELIILGARYQRWLEKNASNVPGYTIAPNAASESSAPSARP
jgi:hypothetical protein